MQLYVCQVGVLEEMNKTLAVFEAFMPRHFRGARQAYWSYASEVNRWVPLQVHCDIGRSL